MNATLETRLAETLRGAIDGLAIGDTIPDSPQLQRILSALEFYLPAVLRQAHGDWKHESLDGVFCELARKTAETRAEIAGLCVLISDQTLTPYHVKWRVASERDEIEWLECMLGEVRNGGMVRIPYVSPDSKSHPAGKLSVAGRLDTIEWKYHVGFGNPSVSDA